MQVLVIILNKVEYLEKIVIALRESGVRGATILDGLGSDQKAMSLGTSSFLANVVEALENRTKVKKVIISLVEKQVHIDKAMEAVDRIANQDGEKTSGAVMMTLPVNNMRGGELERHIQRRELREQEDK